LSGKPNPLIQLILSLPSWLLPAQIKIVKETLRSKEYAKAFIEIMEIEEGNTSPSDYPNSNSWRKAEIPAANGHGTASGIAKFFGILASGGLRDDKRLLKSETIREATTPKTSGPDVVLFQAPYKFGLGYQIDAPFSPIGMKEGMFGHTGIAGATGFADLNHKVGFGFTNNRQHSLGKLYRTSNSLAKKLYEIL
jgi:CubicO group peptidase (beta-lactamase class C family)